MTHVDLLAWGDFNGDGVEDVLLSVANIVTEGTFRVYRHVVLTRHSAGERLRVIQDR